MLRSRRSISVAAAALLAGCAHAGPAPAAGAQAAGASQPAAPEGAGAPQAGPAAVVVTGSRIPQRVDLSTGLPRTTSAVTVWTRPQLDAAGEPGVGDALKKVTP